MLPIQWEQRILFVLRDLEVTIRKAQLHENGPGIEQIAQDTALLKAVINKAFEESHKRA